MRQKIPEITNITCDSCRRCCRLVAPFKYETHLKIKRNALDFNGYAVADGSLEFDLCDDCMFSVTRVINEEIASIRREIAVHETRNT